MGTRTPNHRLVKIHRNYTVEDASEVLNVHKNTVRQWLKSGLPKVDDQRPTLILGRELVAFLQAQRAARKRPCKAGELYCVRCRMPKPPAGAMVDYIPNCNSSGNLKAICPTCNAIMNRRVSLTNLPQVTKEMNVTITEAPPHIVKLAQPSVNSDFR